MTFLWLGLTVLLMGTAAACMTWVGGIGLLRRRCFFLCHGALVGAGVPEGPSPVGCLVAAGVGACVCRAVPVGGDGGALR